MTILNTEKIVPKLLILKMIKAQSSRWFLTKELAEMCKINHKNIGRYLTALENEDRIKIKRGKKDKREKLIRFKPKKVLYFFKYGNKYLHHTRTKLKKEDFTLLKDKYNAKEAKELKLPNDIIRVIISIQENQTTITPEDEVNFELGWGGTTSHQGRKIYRDEFFNLFSKQALEKLKPKYTIHIYSIKEIKYMRNKKKHQNKAYKHIIHGSQGVELLIKKENHERFIPTPFIYYDYFVLRAIGSLMIENNVLIKNEGKENQERTATSRTLDMSTKEFEYYDHIYSFVSFHTHHYNPKYDREPNKELMREAKMVVMKKEMDKVDEYLEMPTLPNYEEFIDTINSRKKMIPKKIFAPREKYEIFSSDTLYS